MIQYFENQTIESKGNPLSYLYFVKRETVNDSKSANICKSLTENLNETLKGLTFVEMSGSLPVFEQL